MLLIGDGTKKGEYDNDESKNIGSVKIFGSQHDSAVMKNGRNSNEEEIFTSSIFNHADNRSDYVQTGANNKFIET